MQNIVFFSYLLGHAMMNDYLMDAVPSFKTMFNSGDQLVYLPSILTIFTRRGSCKLKTPVTNLYEQRGGPSLTISDIFAYAGLIMFRPCLESCHCQAHPQEQSRSQNEYGDEFMKTLFLHSGGTLRSRKRHRFVGDQVQLLITEISVIHWKRFSWLISASGCSGLQTIASRHGEV